MVTFAGRDDGSLRCRYSFPAPRAPQQLASRWGLSPLLSEMNSKKDQRLCPTARRAWTSSSEACASAIRSQAPSGSLRGRSVIPSRPSSRLPPRKSASVRTLRPRSPTAAATVGQDSLLFLVIAVCACRATPAAISPRCLPGLRPSCAGAARSRWRGQGAEHRRAPVSMVSHRHSVRLYGAIRLLSRDYFSELNRQPPPLFLPWPTGGRIAHHRQHCHLQNGEFQDLGSEALDVLLFACASGCVHGRRLVLAQLWAAGGEPPQWPAAAAAASVNTQARRVDEICALVAGTFCRGPVRHRPAVRAATWA